jgi:hypothetical protein
MRKTPLAERECGFGGLRMGLGRKAKKLSHSEKLFF